MILFNLKCAQDHVFEAWFRNNDNYDQQVARKAVACPFCGDRHVEKAIMAPRISKGDNAESPPGPKVTSGAIMAEFKALQKKIEENCDYVGENFAEEARKIHYGEVAARGIYGESTAAEAKELTDEGIAFARVPWIPSYDS